MATMTSESTTPSAATDTGTDDGPTAVQRLRDQADAVVNRIQPRIAAVTSYARDEPTRALLISAATGAALMGLVALIVRSSSSSRPSLPDRGRAGAMASSTLAAIREAALDLAGRAQSMATDVLDAAQQRAADAFDSAQQRASKAFDSVKSRAGDAYDAAQQRTGDTLDAHRKRADEAIDDAKKRANAAAADPMATASDAWKALREQAQPMVDKVRPQIDAMASYAKEDPTRAALGAAAAAALVIGLIALVRGSQDD